MMARHVNRDRKNLRGFWLVLALGSLLGALLNAWAGTTSNTLVALISLVAAGFFAVAAIRPSERGGR